MSRSFSEGPDNRSRKDREFGGSGVSIVWAWFSGAGNVRSSRLGRRIDGAGRGSLATTLMFVGLADLLAAPRMLSAAGKATSFALCWDIAEDETGGRSVRPLFT